ILAAIGLATAASGCREHMPHAFITWPGGGDVTQSHPEPPEGGYYSQWDKFADSVEFTEVSAINPVNTQHYFIVTVKDKNGKPLPNRRVEWIMSSGGVGEIIAVDESGWRNSRGYVVDNHRAVSHTNWFKHVLDLGDNDPSNDIQLTEGQSWVQISSRVEGTSYLTAYVPAIYDESKHKVFAEKHWYDVKWDVPPPATNPTGTTHTFTTNVSKYSNGDGLEGYEVTYRIVDGPAGRFAESSGTSATVYTDGSGNASVTLQQDSPAEGTNNVQIDIVRMPNEACCKPGVHLATEYTSKTWIGPKIAITKDCVSSAIVGETFEYVINVSNPSQVDATNVTVTDNLPNGIQYVSSNPPSSGGGSMSWNLGTIPGGGSSSIRVQVQGTRQGTFENCASVSAGQGLSAQDCCSTTITAPALVIEKTCTPNALLCEPIEYTVIVRNTGDGPANNVRVVDTLPDGITATDGRQTREFNAGNLAPGEAKQARYTANASRTGSFTNRAVATADGGLSAETSCTTNVSNAELSVTKTGDRDTVYIGRDLTYTITVSNSGNADATNVTLTDTVPGGTQFVSASNGGTMSGGAVNWNLGTISAGQSMSVNLTVKANSAGMLMNKACARTRCGEACGTLETRVEGIPAVLLEVVDIEDPDEIGTTETYRITVTNQGSAPATNIRIVATVQPEAEFVSASADFGGGATADGRTVTFTALPSLAPRQQSTFTVIVRGQQAGDTRFKVLMYTNETDPTPIEETESTRFY
ncbi:MAG: hypothetical protein AB7N71_00505, partial [Phycisphaerae bacterium]